MRKRMILFLVVMGLVACTNDDVLEKTVDKEEMDLVQYDPNRRSYSEALEIAQQSIDMFVSDEARGATPTRKISLDNTKYVIKEAESRSGGQDTLMYIFNFEDNQGFSVISANKATEGLLAQTEQGTYDENTETENPAFGMYMDMAEMYVASGGNRPPITPTLPFKEYRMTRDTVETIQVNPLIVTQWGQTGCEATYTPNGYPSGCGNTAMAQIMSHFYHPTQIAINYPGATISSLTLNWTAIRSHKVEHTKQSCSASNDAHNAIGHLLRQLGHLNNASYEEEGTSTAMSNVKSTFYSMGYIVSDIVAYSGTSLSPSISNNNLYFMGGSRLLDDNENYTAHAWVIDGCLRYKIIVKEWTRTSEPDAEWELMNEYPPQYSEYYHINWGWDGNCNGFFNAGTFATNNAAEYDNPNSPYNNTMNRDYKYGLYYFSVTR